MSGDPEYRPVASTNPSGAFTEVAGARISAAPLLVLALLSSGGLLYEIALTRVLSVLYFSTFSYLVLSLAILGLAAGAALAVLFPELRASAHWANWAALAAAAALLSSFIASSALPHTLRYLLFPLAALPYLFLGLAVTAIFAWHSWSSTRLYLADLAGAGLGALLAVPAIDLLGGNGGVLSAAALLAVAALLLGPSRPLPLSAGLLCTVVFVLHAAGAGIHIDPSQTAAPKPLREALRSGAEIEATRWDSFARSDLIRFPDLGRYVIYLDGAAGSLVPDASDPGSWLRDIGTLAFAVDPPEDAFLIGPGGGLDIALARAHEVRRIVAAEINSGAVELTRTLETHAGELYGPPTELVIDDGRSVLRRSQRFDLILLSQVVSQAAEAKGLALAENGLYTVEAFNDYLDHLNPGGRIALKLYDELTLTRALLTALTALEERGIAPELGARHLFAALDTRASPPVPLLLVNAQPLSREGALDWARIAEARGFGLLLVPDLIAPPALAALNEGSAGMADIITGAGDVDLRPTRDDRPFFYQFERGVPRSLRPLFAATAALLAAVLALAAWRSRSATVERKLAPALFTALGAGFMLYEITVLQRTQLLIGHPTVALSVVLATLLLGAAAGSGLAGRVAAGAEYLWAARAAVAAAALGLIWLLLWPAAASAMAALPPVATVAGSALSLLPLALALGAPFPLALRKLGHQGPGEVAVAWTLNGVASVAGAVAATVLAVTLGFSFALTVAVIVYLLAAALAATLHRFTGQ